MKVLKATRRLPLRSNMKLKTLRESARVGFCALDRGKFKEFASADRSQSYLSDLADNIIARLARRSR